MKTLQPQVGSAHCHMVNGTANPTDSCCAHVSNTHFPKFDFHACLNATFHLAGPTFSNATVDLELGLNGKPMFEKMFDLDKLEKVCTPLGNSSAINICADFQKVNITAQTFSACADLEADLGTKKLFGVQIGCFHVNI